MKPSSIAAGLSAPAARRAAVARAAALALTGFVAVACVSKQERVESKEDLLAAAGFIVRPANTPERQASLRSLPPNRFVQRAHGDRVAYVYADPLVCNCLYVGDQGAYGRYRQEVFQRNLADERQITAQTFADDWGWGPWGMGVGW